MRLHRPPLERGSEAGRRAESHLSSLRRSCTQPADMKAASIASAACFRSRVTAAPSPVTGRLPLWTSFESTDRSREDACFALAEQASEEAGPVQLVLVLCRRLALIANTPAPMRISVNGVMYPAAGWRLWTAAPSALRTVCLARGAISPVSRSIVASARDHANARPRFGARACQPIGAGSRNRWRPPSPAAWRCPRNGRIDAARGRTRRSELRRV